MDYERMFDDPAAPKKEGKSKNPLKYSANLQRLQRHLVGRRDFSYYQILPWKLHVNKVSFSVACVGGVAALILFLIGLSIGAWQHYLLRLSGFAAPLCYELACVLLFCGYRYKIKSFYFVYILISIVVGVVLFGIGGCFILEVAFGHLQSNEPKPMFLVIQEISVALTHFLVASIVAFSVPIVYRAYNYLEEKADKKKPLKLGSSEIIVKTIY
ncbi:hypothetical protein M3Y97_00978200 [Aphelenchoides bicaudatus]|nr:hypothetical protein M3Y97_00978200 [Aphelenchoides bicaudatus]